MDDFIARQPITNRKAHVCGYHLAYGRNTRNVLDEIKIGYTEFGQITQSLFFETIDELSDHMMSFIDFSEELINLSDNHATNRALADRTVIVFGKSAAVNGDTVKKLKSRGYKLAFDSTFIGDDETLPELADIIIVDYTQVSLPIQTALIRKFKSKVMFLASKVETWRDYKVACDMGYTLFKGFFFLWPAEAVQQKEIKSLDVCLISILTELDKPEPDFKIISDIIEHDLGLSYKLLRLVNSAYMAPKYRIKSISHALTYLGTRELHQWVSMLMFSGIKSPANSELVKMSLIRGKLMALIARDLQLADTGSEPFFTGLFSLIDVIMNRDISDLLVGLPITEEIKTALRGEDNNLRGLLAFVISYERAEWQKIEGRYPLSAIAPQRMVSLYMEAHRWANLIDDQ